MLNLDMHFERGILIVNLDGELVLNTSKKVKFNLTNLISDNGIKYVLLNLNNIYSIDRYGFNSIIENYKAIKCNNGKLILCGMSNLFKYNHNIYDSLYQIEDEYDVFDLVNI